MGRRASQIRDKPSPPRGRTLPLGRDVGKHPDDREAFSPLPALCPLSSFVTAAINGANIEERLGLDGFTEGALAICGCGIPAEHESAADPKFLPYVPGETVL